MSRKTRKLIWSAPLVAVIAVVGALAIFMTAAPGDISAQTAAVDYQAGSPLNLTVEPGPGAAKRTSLVITWEAPTDGSDMPITGYRVDQSSDGQRWIHLTNMGANVLTHTQSSLKPGTEKYYRVFAMNRAGTGRVSEAISEVTAMISEPGQVGNLRLSSTSDAVTLNWNVPMDNGGTRLIGYLIHFSADEADHIRPTNGIPPRTADGSADVAGNSDGIIPVLATSGTTYVHKGLPADLDMSYKVYAVNWSDDEGVARTTKDPVEKRDTTTMVASRPSAPTGLTAVPLVQYDADGDVVEDVVEETDADPPVPLDVQTNQSATNVNLYWYWPQADGGDGITMFRVEVTKTGKWPSSSADPSVDIAAFNEALVGGVNPAVDFAAVNVQAGIAFGSTAETPQQFEHLAAATNFLNGSGKQLQYRVFAINGAGHRSLPSSESSQSTVTYAMTQATKPAPKPPTAVAWTNRVAAIASTHHYNEVNLSWEKPAAGGTPSAYRIDLAETKSVYTRNAGGTFTETPVAGVLAWKEQERDTRHSDPTYDHRGWRPKGTPQTFNYRVFAKDGGLIGEASDINAQIVDGQTAPEPVTSLASTVISANQIDVSWSEPGNDGGIAITSYCFLSTSNATVGMPNTLCNTAADADDVPDNIKREIIDAPAVGVLTERAPDTMDMSKGLLAATTYRHQVYATNQATNRSTLQGIVEPPGFSPSSDDDPKTTLDSTKPVAPAMLSAEQAKDSNFVSNQDRGVLIMWTGPADPDGAKIEGYEVQRKVNDGEFLLQSESSDRTTHYTDMTPPGTDDVRMYQVRARNKLGWSPWSAAITSPLPEPSATPPAVDELTAPSGVTVSKLRDTVSVTWDPASIENAAQVKVVLFDSGVTKIVDLKTFNAANDPGAATFTGVDSGTYKVTVASFRTGDRHKLSALMEVTIE